MDHQPPEHQQPTEGSAHVPSAHIKDLPPYAKIPRACDLLGIARTKLYAHIGEGSIRAVKCGGRTLIDMTQALAWMATLPQANIAPQARRLVAA